MTIITGWHFVGDTLRDGRPVPRDGVWLEHDGPIVICESGLHGSRRPADALKYAPGPVLCLCDFDGVYAEHHDKLVAYHRRIVRRIDATELLRYFARMQALSVAHLWDAPNVVLDYLMTGDESIRNAARAAAWDAAMAAEMATAMAAAMAATWDAAWAVAWDAARAATWDATRAVTWDAARAVTWDAARAAAWEDFDALVYETMGGNDE